MKFLPGHLCEDRDRNVLGVVLREIWDRPQLSCCLEPEISRVGFVVVAVVGPGR